MSGINKVILVGHLGRDPEIRTLDTGAKVASFSLATSETYKNKEGQKIDMTEWHNIVVWRGLADIAEKYLKKGNLVYLEGRIKTRSYEKDGIKKYMTEIVADTMQMLGGRKDADVAETTEDTGNEPEASSSEPAGDDLPF
jgi:single-strand DNA-binding protein